MNPKSDATTYLLTLLLQRTEELKPGLLDELIEGVAADKEGIQVLSEHSKKVFEEALTILHRANQTPG